MKIIVFSDSHGDVAAMASVLRAESADAVIHLGDHIDDARELRRMFPSMTFHLVAGNTDGRHEKDTEAVLSLGDRRVLITHGHYYDVKRTYAEVRRRGRAEGADAVLFGHTHIPHIGDEDGVRLMNPGTIGRRGSRVTYGVLEIGADDVRCEVIEGVYTS